MNTKNVKDLMLEWYDRVWRQNDESAIYELMNPECHLHGLGEPITGPEEFAAFHRAFAASFADVSVEVIEMLESDSTSIGHATFNATHLPTSIPVSFDFSFSVKWLNGQAIEGRNVVDFASLLAQIGVLDPSVFAKSLLATS